MSATLLPFVRRRARSTRSTPAGPVAVAFSLGILAGAACSDGTAPLSGDAVVGTYVLRTVAGAPPPWYDSPSDTVGVGADTVNVIAGGDWTEVTIYLIGPDRRPLRASYFGTWNLDTRSGVLALTNRTSIRAVATTSFTVLNGGRGLRFEPLAGPSHAWIFEKLGR